MPFTFSHPAIVLPFFKIRSSYISASCLIVGSIIPDFEYFFTMKATGRFSHTVPGAFVFDLPVALAVVLIFHQIVKKPFIDSLPAYAHTRLTALREFDFLKNLKDYLAGYIACLLIGIFSHIAWDSFTHSNEYFVKRFAELASPIHVKFLPSWPLYRYLQHISTFLGAIAVLYFFHHQSGPPKPNKLNMTYWISALFIGGVTFSIRWSIGFEYFADIAATLISSILLGIVIISLIYYFRSFQLNKTQ